MKAKDKINQTKRYYSIAEPKTWYVIKQYLIKIIQVSLVALTSVFTAKIIVGVYRGISTGDFSYAYQNLVGEFACIVLRNLFTWFNYLTYNQIFNSTFMTIQNKTINKILKAKQSNFTTTSSEKIQNILVGDVDVLASFPDNLCTKVCQIIQAIISLVIVAVANVWVAIILALVCGINFFILRAINTRIANAKKKQYEAKDNMYEEVNRILAGKEIINELHANKRYDKEFKNYCKEYTKADKNRYTIVGFKDSWFYVYYRLIVALLTAAMIFFVSKGNLDVELYVVVVPYFLTVTELFNSFFEITGTIADRNVSLSRVDIILNFTPEELNKFGDISSSLGGTNISLIDVYYSNLDVNSKYSGILEDVDISFSSKNINLVYGDKRCGKRLIFNLLRRQIKPERGVVMLDNININDYSYKTFSSNIYYCTSYPKFIEGSIMDNLKVIEKSKKKIYEVCKTIGVYEDIMAKPKKFDTVIDSSFTRGQLFLLGLARAMLTNCQTLMVYELPSSITKKDKKRILKAIIEYSKTHTVIFFSHDDEFRAMAKTVYHIDNGKVKDIKINNMVETKVENLL